MANLLCTTGLILIGAALWLVYPAAAVAFAGVVAVAAGVHLHRRRRTDR